MFNRKRDRKKKKRTKDWGKRSTFIKAKEYEQEKKKKKESSKKVKRKKKEKKAENIIDGRK